jgi:outer membrane biosynthesis protein TonB
MRYRLAAFALLVFVASLDAAARQNQPGPLAAYEKTMKDRIGSLWFRYMNSNRNNVAVGTVTLSFRVTAKGEVTHLKIQSKTPNRLVADICVRTIREVKLLPLPNDLLNVLRKSGRDWLQVDNMNFKVYPN